MGIVMIRISVLYFAVGVIMGILIHAIPELRAVHPHLNLLGWVSLALAGLIYTIFPQAGNSKLGKIHFWLHVVGIPVLLFGLFQIGYGRSGLPFAPLGGLLIVIGTILFAVNLFLNTKPENRV
jgi:cbb3-type cytochrome oxidase subunit 1